MVEQYPPYTHFSGADLWLPPTTFLTFWNWESNKQASFMQWLAGCAELRKQGELELLFQALFFQSLHYYFCQFCVYKRVQRHECLWRKAVQSVQSYLLQNDYHVSPLFSCISTTSNVVVCYRLKHFCLQMWSNDTSYEIEHAPALRLSINKTNKLPYNYIIQAIWLPNFAKALCIVTDVLFTSMRHCAMLVDDLSMSNQWDDHCLCNMKATRAHQKGWGSHNGPIPHWSWIKIPTHLLQTVLVRLIFFFKFPGSFLLSGAWWCHKPNLSQGYVSEHNSYCSSCEGLRECSNV